MNRATLVIADDHTMIAEAFRNLLEPEYQVVATVQDGRALLETALQVKPDVVVVDIGMPVLNGLSAGQQLKQRLSKVKIIYLTMNADPDLAAEALRTGGSAYLLKSSAASELLKSIHEVLRGGTYVTPKIKKRIEESFIRSTRPKFAEKKLTPRQVQVLQSLAEGKSMKEVATGLSLAPRTVAFHKYCMMEALSVRTHAELIQFAVRNNIVSDVDAARKIAPTSVAAGTASPALCVG